MKRLSHRCEPKLKKNLKKNKQLTKTQIIEASKIHSFYLNIVALISIVIFLLNQLKLQ